MVTASVLLLLLAVFSPPVCSHFTTPHYIPGDFIYTKALETCRRNYTDLITVYSDEENNELINMMPKTGYHESWIGLSRSQFSEKWSNGDPVTFRNLAVDCGPMISCAAMKVDGLWECFQCTATKHFMCYEQDHGAPKYHLIFETKTWYEAQSYCREKYTDLVSIRDQQQNKEVTSKGKNSTMAFWIGLLWDDWQWADGGNSAYRNWSNNHPRLSPSDCLILTEQGWYTIRCSFRRPVLCYRNSLHVSEKALSWQKALHYCHEENRAGMLTIDSQAEQEELESELRKRGVPLGSLWVRLGPKRLSELKESSRPLTCDDVQKRTEARGSHCTPDTCSAEAAQDYVMDSTELRVVCNLKRVP